jgi:rSAM/selenodomain-associated transferase 1
MPPLNTPRLVVFAKAPLAGMAKTRLIPALGAEGAARLAQRFLDHALAQALQAQVGAVELCMSPGPDDAAWQGVELPESVQCTDQGEGDLGERMARVVHRVTSEPQGQPILLMGTDCPALTAEVIAEATRQLACHDAVLVPVADGGYVLLGLRVECSEVFAAMPWSTPAVAAETLRRLALRGLRLWLGPTLHDIDEPADLFYLPRAWNFRSDWPIPSVKQS